MKVTIGELNKICLFAFKKAINKVNKSKTREYCLFALVEDKEIYRGFVIDRKTSTSFLYLIPKEFSGFYNVAIMTTIFQKLLKKQLRVIDKSPRDSLKPYNWEKPMTARGRSAIYEGHIKEGEATIHLFSWSKVLL